MPLRRFRRQYEQLSQFERRRIIGRIEAGWSARQVARQLGRSDCVVRRCWDQGIPEMPFTLKPGYRPVVEKTTTYSDDNHVRVWRPRGKRLNPAFSLQPHTASTAGVMVWGDIAYNTRSPLVLIRGTVTAQREAEKEKKEAIDANRTKCSSDIDYVILQEESWFLELSCERNGSVMTPAVWCPSKNKQHANEQLSLLSVVTTSRYINTLRLSHRKKSNSVRSDDHGGHRTDPHIRYRRRSMLYPANHVQEHKNAP
ncbi:transposable element Tcb2 transposase [Trichonephila clavipes]|nr:transposable element Tcb2 transposase [Trichonephila clavipes]